MKTDYIIKESPLKSFMNKKNDHKKFKDKYLAEKNHRSFPFFIYVLDCTGSCKKYHRLGDLNNRTLFYSSFRDLKSKIKVLSGLVSGESVFCLLDDCFLVCPPRAFSLHMEKEKGGKG